MRTICAAVALFLAIDASPLQISKSGKGAFEASLTSIGNQLVAAWYDTRDGHPEIYMRLLDERGRPAGPERRITHGADADHAYEPDVATVNTDVAIAWYEQNQTTKHYRARLALVTRGGRTLWTRMLSSETRDGKGPVVRVANGEIVVAWLEGERGQPPHVMAQWFDLKGRPLAPAADVAPAGKTTWNLNAAVDVRGRVALVFDATTGTKADELFLAHLDKASNPVTRLTADDGKPSKYPDIAFSGSRAALSWQDERDGNEEVYLFIAPAADVPQGFETKATRITDTPGASIGAYLTWNGDVLGLAWCDNSTNRQHEVYLAEFNADGSLHAATRRLTENPSDSLIPAIQPWKDGFALVWNEFVPGKAGGHGDDGRSEVWSAWVPR